MGKTDRPVKDTAAMKSNTAQFKFLKECIRDAASEAKKRAQKRLDAIAEPHPVKIARKLIAKYDEDRNKRADEADDLIDGMRRQAEEGILFKEDPDALLAVERFERDIAKL